MSKYLSALILLLLVACSDEHKPAGIIKKEKFVEILTDIRTMEAAYGMSFKQKDSVKVSINALYDSLFEAKTVTEKDFLDSYRYYSRTASELSDIEDRVMENLTNAHLELEQKISKDSSADSLLKGDSINQQ